MDKLLFNDGELRLALEAQQRRLVTAVDSVPEEHLRQADVEEWVTALVEEFKAECPELLLDELYREAPEEVRVDVSRDSNRYFSPYNNDRTVAGHRVVVGIPFNGDEAVFKLRSSSFTYNPPAAQVKGDELVYSIEFAHDTQPDIDGQVSAFVGTVQKWLGFARSDIDMCNNGLEQVARSAIATRRTRLEQRDETLAKSSIPVGRPKKGGKTYIAEAIVRRPAPARPKPTGVEPHVQLEPVLGDELFEHMLSKVRMQALQMEQSPRTYAGMDEEARRDIILGMLNTHYEGRGTAEAFNVSGRTDILIRWDGRSIFIAECKYWEGAKAFAKAIDQLFGYASWRDTKLALIVFVREKGLTEIIEKARDALERHPHFVSSKKATAETELRAGVSWPGDERRNADLNVFFVHAPAA